MLFKNRAVQISMVKKTDDDSSVTAQPVDIEALTEINEIAKDFVTHSTKAVVVVFGVSFLATVALKCVEKALDSI